MNKIILTLVLLATNVSLIKTAEAQDSIQNEPKNSNQVINACIQNQAETLPNPFSDVPSDHWAFKAVMTMHYCGAFRNATPPALFQQLKPAENPQTLPPNQQQFQQ
ncbi:S-layer protein [Tolypothrix sp. FACHB-123]|uniref:S-layer protein n=1 Tax=Tolypothrix sp. FACHB-123 TaxID=2692868 RepID=UPI00168A0908|nr:S-layer protein [Tolypothrix sp. FACHB-123]MBD2355823.1 S-layer protein [Tolypothrix sp. FACHB-123]